MKKFLILIAFIVVTIFGLSACAEKTDLKQNEAQDNNEKNVEDTDKKYNIIFGHPFNPDTPQANIADEFKKQIEEESNGRITVEIFAAGQLGSNIDMYEGMQMGTQQMSIIPSARITGFAPSLQILDLPFLFPDRETAYKIFDGDVGRELLDTLEPTGIRGLSICEDGFKHFTSSKEIKNLADFKGLKMRTMESPIIMEQFKSLGSNPLPIDYTELYNALQQKTVDGQENPLATVATLKLYEVQDYLLYSEHAYLAQLLLMSNDFYKNLPEDLQKLVDKVAKNVTDLERVAIQNIEKEYLEEIEKSGTKVIYLDNDEREKMREAVKSVYEVARDIVGGELLDKVVDATK